MVAWRAAGINYVRFSQIAAAVTKQCTKTGGTKKAYVPTTFLKVSYLGDFNLSF
ncbi:unnamed protein product [Nippostrongylus brasiliensis]|uniref:Transposase n=1 Tax=Nippostrongylus brasiliensis TaxID=27835 RepID=A0A0N4XS19_NIPBR|nr:unnamed protein product [Nippostrongylus brasiliensis]